MSGGVKEKLRYILAAVVSCYIDEVENNYYKLVSIALRAFLWQFFKLEKKSLKKIFQSRKGTKDNIKQCNSVISIFS